MKTSYKLLITTAGLVVALLITGLITLRKEMKAIIAKAEKEYHYKEVPVERFEKLDFSGNWIVYIRQGRERKVEWTAGEEVGKQPLMENRNGTLFFTREAASEAQNRESWRAKIIVPSLNAIQTTGKVQIHLRNFESDTLSVVLKEGGEFMGHNSHFNHVSFQTSGDAWFEFTDDVNHTH